MIQSEQLSPDTIVFHMSGPLHQSAIKELSLSVLRSHHLGFTTFLFDLGGVSLMDEQGSRYLALIGQGIQEKGGTWRAVNTPPSLESRLISTANLENLPQETWN